MTDTTATPEFARPSRSDRAALTSRRHASEKRFRFYGVASIVVTAIFLVLVLADILYKGLPAFTESRLNLDITATKEALDPTGAGDRKALLAGDYDTLIRDKLRSEFPGVEARADRRLLNGLLSSGAADDFRKMVVADPSLVGQTVNVPVLLSDDADQYLKGYQTDLETTPGKGDLDLVVNGEQVEARSTADDFQAAVGRVRQTLQDRLDTMDAEIKRLGSLLDGLSPEAAASLRDQIATRQTAADAARAALADGSSGIDLNSSLPSLMVVANDGWLRVKTLSATGIVAEAISMPTSLGRVPASQWQVVELTTPEGDRRVGDKEVAWLEQLKSKGEVERAFATRFFTSGDSREPELAGLRGALIGSLITLGVTLLLCLPIGVGAAIYLEEFAPKNRVTELIEININNLAAVPSIVFGLLGLAMFLNFFGLPRSAPLVGGLVLALLVLPTIIIASRAALRSVPPSIKQAALGVGASQQQAIFHHVLPVAMPGIMTGTIIGMAHALGETAPLLMIGMVAFIVDIPSGITQAATVLPVQIYLWSDLPEVAFQAKTAATIIVLLLFLFAMNSAAILLRKRFERRW
ncbi:MAG: phosphate ABC transporter permease PstA [Rhizobiaceae bacterium]